jgi:hypothetical protein
VLHGSLRVLLHGPQRRPGAGTVPTPPAAVQGLAPVAARLRSPLVPEDPSLVAVERWFVRRGLPHFQEGYDARTDIWTRAIPLLVAWYVLGALNALDLGASVAYNLGAAAVVAAILVGTWVLANVLRRRPAFEVPRAVGPWELVVVVVGPVVPALVLGEWRDAGETLVLGLVVLGLVYLGTSYGLLAMVRWALGETRDLLSTLLALFTRALPLLLVAVLVLFLTAESWQVFGALTGPAYPASLLLLFVVGAAFVLARLPGDLAAVAHFDDWAEVDGLVGATPAATLAPVGTSGPAPGDLPGLDRRQWLNVALVTLFGQGVQVTLVGLVVGAALTAFGTAAITAATVESWNGSVHVLASFTLRGHVFSLTEQTLRVAGFLAAFSALTFTVYLATDETYRREFREEVVGDIRRAFAVRARYLVARSATTP